MRHRRFDDIVSRPDGIGFQCKIRRDCEKNDLHPLVIISKLLSDIYTRRTRHNDVQKDDIEMCAVVNSVDQVGSILIATNGNRPVFVFRKHGFEKLQFLRVVIAKRNAHTSSPLHIHIRFYYTMK